MKILIFKLFDVTALIWISAAISKIKTLPDFIKWGIHMKTLLSIAIVVAISVSVVAAQSQVKKENIPGINNLENKDDGNSDKGRDVGQTTITFAYTGAEQTFTVPKGVTLLFVEAWGGGGGGGGGSQIFSGPGGPGS